ncbi:Cation/calcium exchanger 1 [Apostasia shenzhenica]|uniref:Cation/calcium exchanger 1 n=1 Tax=Apostasia shenzhenica TaxID=1088818 RepID=A0A2I0A9S0_9ASPA|nr:Cation/calcium exchanger 1 [Apostasia shenzhenica]
MAKPSIIFSFNFFFFLFILLLVAASPLHLHQSAKPLIRRSLSQLSHERAQDDLCDLRNLKTAKSKCDFLSSSDQCSPQGYINYLRLFYCVAGDHHPIGLAVLLLWLIVLFYLLGSTAATYFCSSLEGLSRVLRISPAIAGVTLLSLGNGAPDVFASIASFRVSTAPAASMDVGLNSVLGGALFVTTVVVGVVSICVEPRRVAVDKLDFIRDASFLLLVLLALTAILVAGEISVWVAMGFALLYLVYVGLVYVSCYLWKPKTKNLTLFQPAIDGDLEAPLLIKSEEPKRDLRLKFITGRALKLLEFPLALPRKMTIPDISEERWSKPFAVISASMAPVLLAALWDSKAQEPAGSPFSSSSLLPFSGLLGILTGTAAFLTTEKEGPPARFRLPWLAGGFLMSVTWTYVTAEELVSLLVSLGTILGISPALLGLTVLAWGDSLGDLTAAAAMAVNGGASGAQVAVSGCYAGPTFNALVGLGVPMAMSSCAAWPSSAPIVVDSGVFETLGFLAGGLLWALVVLPKREMKPDRVLGCGLIAVYLCFLSLRLTQSLGQH